jgi:hypothetical protein
MAFENSVCGDYVTEKFWNLKKLIVPVVLTRMVFANLWDNVPNGSFIAVDDFATVAELATHLKWLALPQNKEHYMKFTMDNSLLECLNVANILPDTLNGQNSTRRHTMETNP